MRRRLERAEVIAIQGDVDAAAAERMGRAYFRQSSTRHDTPWLRDMSTAVEHFERPAFYFIGIRAYSRLPFGPDGKSGNFRPR